MKYGAFFESKKIIEKWLKEGHDNPLYNNIPGILDIGLQNLIPIIEGKKLDMGAE